MDPLVPLARALNLRGVRYVLIGVAGVNLWAHSAGVVFSTHDKDLFLPLDPDNCLSAWEACEALGFTLWSGAEPLDRPRDRSLAEAVVAHRATIRASDVDGALQADLSLVMGSFDFDTIWSERRTFRVDDVDLPVARLLHIVESKAQTGRAKDRLFLATHADALRQLLPEHDERGT